MVGRKRAAGNLVVGENLSVGEMPPGDRLDGVPRVRLGQDHDAVDEGKVGAHRCKRQVENVGLRREIDHLAERRGKVVGGAGDDVGERRRDGFTSLAPRGRPEARGQRLQLGVIAGLAIDAVEEREQARRRRRS